MNKDETLKQIVDTFGELSFLLETAVKLHQTGHQPEIKSRAFYAAQELADKMFRQLETLNNPQDEA